MATVFPLIQSLVTKLNDVRDDNATYNNRLDTTLADVFSLLSLFYLTIGKTKDTPATYSQIASMRVSATFRFTHPIQGTPSACDGDSVYLVTGLL